MRDAKDHLISNLWEKFHHLSARDAVTVAWMRDFIQISRYASTSVSSEIQANLGQIPATSQFEWGVDFHNRIQKFLGKSEVGFETVRNWIGYTGLPVRSVPFVEGSGFVPRIIHQIWIGDGRIPYHCEEWVNQLGEMNPEMEHRFWGNELFDRYENDALIQKMIEMNAKWPYIADRFRLLLLREFGGIYIDVDVEPLKPLEDLILVNEKNDFTTAKRFKCKHPDLDILIAKRGSGVVDQLLAVEQTVNLGKPLIEAMLLSENISYTDPDYWYAQPPSQKSFLQSEGNHLLTWMATKIAA